MKKSFKLPREFGEKWLNALRGGEYKQGKSNLVYILVPNINLNELVVENVSFCCLGVAGHLCGNSLSDLLPFSYLEAESEFKAIPKELVGDNENALVDVLSSLNDGVTNTSLEDFKTKGYHFREDIGRPDNEGILSLNFAQIADFIEDNIEFYDTLN